MYPQSRSNVRNGLAVVVPLLVTLFPGVVSAQTSIPAVPHPMRQSDFDTLAETTCVRAACARSAPDYTRATCLRSGFRDSSKESKTRRRPRDRKSPRYGGWCGPSVATIETCDGCTIRPILEAPA